MKGIKRDHIPFTLYALLLLLGTTSCFSQEAVRVKFLQLQEKNDSLHVGYQLQLPSQSVESGQGLHIVPMIQAGDSVLRLPQMTVLGENKHKVLKRYHNNRKLGNSYSSLTPNDLPYHYHVRVPYQLWMDSARVCVRQEVSGYRGNKVVTEYQLTDQVELEARIPYQVVPHVGFIVPQKEEKRRSRQGKAFLDFPAGRSGILPAYRRNPQELRKIDDAVRDVIDNKDAVLLGLYVEGFASPEGSYATNERLSGERAIALKEYIKAKFTLHEKLFTVSSIAEDWEGLEVLVKASDLPHRDKALEIITSEQTPDAKETALKRMGVTYRTLLKDLFPELRRVEYQIDYSVRDYDVEEAKKLLDKNPADLSQYELYNLALSHEEGSKEYNSILLEIIPRHFADDATAHTNSAAVLIKNGEMNAAKRQLEKAGSSAEAINNRGIIFMLEGDLDKADEYFDRAQQAGSEAAARNKQEVKTKRADNRKMERYSRMK
ncbi:outer membrane protein OmpA-like peptidoglycan-associated protein [Bacteroides reticulotermitis]|uniref:Outer membrane protein OmpA-like peptidoglycan-associated protein n=4 Tax=Bacteroides reticulotermitis TaxID=1133319 RepID=A0A840CV95_9BACE|nr:DUF3868 domain-containing protein [Bacteroides reticulotermitis]MBB4042489.1 outer membrane protein OmpA-like peptidoglycan-associated protein [Bacteroides reticulotermitis]